MTDDIDELPPATRAHRAAKHEITQEKITEIEDRNLEIYRKRTEGAVGLLVPRNHPKAKWANWDTGWERECALNRNNPEFLSMMRGQARAFGVTG